MAPEEASFSPALLNDKVFPAQAQPISTPLTPHSGVLFFSLIHQAHCVRERLTTGCPVPWEQDNEAASLFLSPLRPWLWAPCPICLLSSPEPLTILTDTTGPWGTPTWAPNEKEGAKLWEGL